MSENPYAKLTMESNHHGPLLTMVHDSLNQFEIIDS